MRDLLLELEHARSVGSDDVLSSSRKSALLRVTTGRPVPLFGGLLPRTAAKLLCASAAVAKAAFVAEVDATVDASRMIASSGETGARFGNAATEDGGVVATAEPALLVLVALRVVVGLDGPSMSCCSAASTFLRSHLIWRPVKSAASAARVWLASFACSFSSFLFR